MHKDLYEILGVPRSAGLDEIKAAYKKLARKYHPDICENKAEAEARFKEINMAYTVLSDEEKRAYYDRYGKLPSENGSGFPGWGFDSAMDFGFSEVFDLLFDLGGRRRGTGREAHRPQRGADLRYNLELTLEEAYLGVEKEISFEVNEVCPDCGGKKTQKGKEPEVCQACNGTGQISQVQQTFMGRIVQSYPCARCRGEGVFIAHPCHSCQGQGKITKKKTLKVKIPPGVDSDSRIRLSNEGELGSYGGPRGDLYVFLYIKEHKLFKREGANLYLNHKLTFTQAALGDEIEIPSLAGEVKLKIPPGTQNGTEFKLRGKGMPHLQRSGYGDLIVTIQVMVPTRLNQKQKELLQEFAKSGSQEAEDDKSFFQKIKDNLF
jgi:molecular chaperone DnaJ